MDNGVSRIVVPTTDKGSVDFDVDFKTGLVNVTVRPPLALPSAAITVPVPLIDFMEIAGRTVVEWAGQSRAAAAQMMQNGILSRRPR